MPVDARPDRRKICSRPEADEDERQLAGLALDGLERHQRQHRAGVAERLPGRVDADHPVAGAVDVDVVADGGVPGSPRPASRA